MVKFSELSSHCRRVRCWPNVCHQIAMVTKDRSLTLFTFLTILPLHILLPTYAYFLLITIFGILLLLKYLPKQNILLIATVLSLCLMLNYVFPNFYILFTINVVSLLLLFQQLLPTYTFCKIIQIIVSVLFLRYTLPMYTLLSISIIGLFALLQYDVRLRKSVRCCFSYSFLVLSAAVVSFIILPIAILRPWNIKNLLLGAYFTRPLSYLLGIKWEIRNAENMLPDTTSAVIVSNHQSALDVLGMLYVISRLNVRCTAVGRKLIFWLWPFGLTLWLSGVAFISRKPNFQKTHLQMNEAAELIDQQRAKIWIFPEGTRNTNSQYLLPFKKGAFRVAIKNQIPIVPIVFSPYYFANWHEQRFESGTILVDIMPSIPTTGLTYANLDELIYRTYAFMAEKYTELIIESTLLYNTNK